MRVFRLNVKLPITAFAIVQKMASAILVFNKIVNTTFFDYIAHILNKIIRLQ